MIETAPGRVTFAVSDVEPAADPLPEEPAAEAVAAFLRGPVEACAPGRGALVAGVRSHPLVGALHAAFCDHRPVCLSPDAVWLTLAQGFAHHVNAHAEDVRPLLVRHAGTVALEVRRDDFVKGSPDNPWPEVFAAFSDQIRGHVGAEAHGLVVSDFSTTGAAERAASEVVLFDAVQRYFAFEVHTVCGIPSVTLEGTPRDWRSVAERAERFARFGLDWWVGALRPILAQFVAAAEGCPDPAFWEGVYKWEGPEGSGSPHVSGWVRDLFPYLHNPAARPGRPPQRPLCRNPYVGAAGQDGPGRDEFPGTPGCVPFRWHFLGRVFEMEFVGGLVGVRQDRGTLALRPEVGWAVRPGAGGHA